MHSLIVKLLAPRPRFGGSCGALVMYIFLRGGGWTTPTLIVRDVRLSDCL